MQILKRIAFISRASVVPGHRAEIEARKELDRMTFDRIDPDLVLRETAQFYGIMTKTDEGWEFVHRSIQDFLAAKYWVESGQFAAIQRYEWNTRTAYAACLSYDSTKVLLSALRNQNALSTAAEILSNAPNFDMGLISNELLAYYSKEDRSEIIDHDPERGIAGFLKHDLLRLTTNRFLNFMIEEFAKKRNPVAELLIGYCLVELKRRNLKLDFSSYDTLFDAFGKRTYQFVLDDRPSVTLAMLRPGI